MKTGLVLEGGGLRGIFSAGVLDVLMEEGIEFDGAVGVSAGAAFGCNYKSRQPRRAIRYNLKFAKDPRYSSVRSLLKTGDLFNAQFCYHDIPEKLFPFDWKTFRENPMQFYLVCTDVETGKPVYHLCDNDPDWEGLEWFRASGSMPMVSRIVEVDGYRLLDGGISDSIPLRFMEEQGFARNVVILTRPAGYVKKPASMIRVMRRTLHDYPAVVDAIANRHLMYNETLAYIRQREAGKYALVIRPETDLDVGRVEHDREKIRAAYKAGRRAARRRLPEIRRFLKAAKNGAENNTVLQSESPGTLIDGRPRTLAERQEEEGRRKAAAQQTLPGTEGPQTADQMKSPEKSQNTENQTDNQDRRNTVEHSEKTGTMETMPGRGEEEAMMSAERPEASRLTSPETSAAVTGFSRRRRSKKAWKPGKMTALRQQSEKNAR